MIFWYLEMLWISLKIVNILKFFLLSEHFWHKISSAFINNNNFCDCFEIKSMFCHPVVAYQVILMKVVILVSLVFLIDMLNTVNLVDLVNMVNLVNLLFVVNLVTVVNLGSPVNMVLLVIFVNLWNMKIEMLFNVWWIW